LEEKDEVAFDKSGDELNNSCSIETIKEKVTSPAKINKPKQFNFKNEFD
jgi:hypothetical protein